MNVTIRPLDESDLDAADTILRLAFGTFLGLPDPMQFAPGTDFVRPRWRASQRGEKVAAIAAEVDGRLVGSSFATIWGSFGFFGPITVHPDLWGKRIAQRLLEPTVEFLRPVPVAGLFTFPHSTKHVGLYQKFGFWPRFLTPFMMRPVAPGNSPCTRLSSSGDVDGVVKAAAALTDTLFEGLDLATEIRSVEGFGDVVLLEGNSQLDGFAICHCGSASEAGDDACYVKFAAVRNGGDDLGRLLAGCDALAAERGLSRVVAGVNTARSETYGWMLANGFKTVMQGVAMHRPDLPAHCRPGAWALDDWR